MSKRVVVTISIDSKVLDKLNERKDIVGVPRSEQVRRALMLYFYVLERSGSGLVDEVGMLNELFNT